MCRDVKLHGTVPAKLLVIISGSTLSTSPFVMSAYDRHNTALLSNVENERQMHKNKRHKLSRERKGERERDRVLGNFGMCLGRDVTTLPMFSRRHSSLEMLITLTVTPCTFA